MKIPINLLDRLVIAQEGANPRILIVDDSNVARANVRAILQKDYEVDEALGGAQAIELLRKAEVGYSAIILDLVMPEVDGWAVLKFLRECGIILTVPVVVVTASAIDLHTVSELYESGAWQVIGKPFDAKLLLALVKGVCGRAAVAAALASAAGELAAVFEGTAAAVFAVDAATGEIVRANGRFNAMVGCSRATVGLALADVVGQSAELFSGVVRDTVEAGSAGPVLVESLKTDCVDVLFCELLKCAGSHDLVVGTLVDITAMAKRLRELEAAASAGRRA